MSDAFPTARYVLDADLLVQALLRGTADVQRRVRLRYAAYAVVMVLTWLVLHPISSSGPTSFLLLYGAVVFSALAVLRPWMVRRQIERSITGRSDIGQAVELRVAPDELRVEVSGVIRSVQRLASIYAAIPSADGTMIQPFPNEFMWVPATAFASADERSRFDQALLAGLRIPDPAL